MKQPRNRFLVILTGFIGIIVVAVICGYCLFSHRPVSRAEDVEDKSNARLAAVETNLVPQMPSNTTTNSLTAVARVLPNYSDFQPRPFPVAYESAKIQWTLADGKDTNVIRQLAHNPLEYARMVEENPRILKRQLVYLKETPAAVFERAKLTGNSVTQLTLPGLDGQELPFVIVKARSNNGSSRRGMLSGHLIENVDSLVTLAFQDGREAFTVLSPKENLFIVGEPREDGQVIVKAIDPNTYGHGPEEANDVVNANSTKK